MVRTNIFRHWLRNFQFFGIFILDNENAGGSAICIHRDLLPEGASNSHVITCHSRDHLVNIQSWATQSGDH